MRQAGKLSVKWQAKISQFTKDMSKARKELQTSMDKTVKFGKAMRKAGAAITGMGVGIAAALGTTIKKAADFEQQMAGVATMLEGDTGPQIEKFSSEILQMSKDFGEGTETLSKGLYDILSAGVDSADAMGVLGEAAKAAKAGFTDTGTAADALTTIMNSYNLEAQDAGDISDWLFSIVKEGKTTFGELAPVIGRVAPLAASAGLSLEEMGASLATMTANGIRTDQAVTSLRTVVQAFVKPTAEGKKAAEALGIELNKVTLEEKGLAGVLDIVNEGTDEQKTAIFGNVRALAGLAPIMNDAEKHYANLDAVTDRAGKSQRAFNEATDTAQFRFDQAKQSMIAVSVQLGTKLLPLVTDFLNEISVISDRMLSWIDKNEDLAATIMKVSAAVGGIAIVLGPTLMALGQFLIIAPKLAIAVKAITLAFTGLNPIVLGATLAIAGLTTAYLKYKKAVDEANESTDLAAEKQKEVIATAKGGVNTWKEYGSASVEALKRQNMSLEQAKAASKGMYMMEAELRRAGQEEEAEKWRKRAELYKQYYTKYQEDLAVNHEQEKEKQTEHDESMLEQYGVTMEELNTMDAERLAKFGEMSEEMKALIDSIMKARDAEADKSGENAKTVIAGENAKARAVGNAAGNIIDGNIAAAISSLVASYISSFGFIGVALSAAAPSIVRKLMPDVPKFAEGGIVSGPTMGMMGEYPGVKSNPEVIAPLDKLQGLGGTNINIDHIIDVDTLSPENVDQTLFRVTEGIKRKLPAAIEFVKRSGELQRDVGGLA